MRSFLISVCLITSAFLLTGCLHTELRVRENSDDVRRLLSFNSKPLNLTVSSPDPEDSLGHQFLLLVIPFGRITLPSTQEPIEHVFTTQLALRGYHPTPKRRDTPRVPGVQTLDVVVKSLSLTAYDYIFVRRIQGTIQVSAILYDTHGHAISSWGGIVSDYTIRPMAFERELEFLLYRTLDAAANKVLNEVMLY